MPMQSQTGSRSSGGPMRRPQASRSPPPACASRSRAAGRCCTTSRSRCGRASWWRSSAAAVQGRRCCSRRWRASAPPSGARCASTASTSTPSSTPSAAFSATSRRTTSFTPSCRSSGLSGTRRGCACRRRSPRRRSTRPSRERSPRSTSQSGRHVRVGALSGGQCKRASFAVELLTRPHVFFLDEPTAGLDPASGAELLRVLRDLADAGSTVVFTTHAVQDLGRCDRLVFLARDGHLAFAGTLEEALRYFGVERIEDVYERLADQTPDEWARRFADHRGDGATATPREASPEPRERSRPGFLRQWAVL